MYIGHILLPFRLSHSAKLKFSCYLPSCPLLHLFFAAFTQTVKIEKGRNQSITHILTHLLTQGRICQRRPLYVKKGAVGPKRKIRFDWHKVTIVSQCNGTTVKDVLLERELTGLHRTKVKA